jgi:hypothetical protein
VVTTSYDGANRPSALTGTFNSTPTSYLSNLSYAPHGGWTSHTYGNQLARSYTYNNRLQPTEMKDLLPSLTNPALDLQYFWGSTVLNGNSTANNGALTGQQIATQTGSGNPVVQFNQSYGYDGLIRLQTSSDTGGWSEQFGYDRYGNVYLSATPSGLPIQTQMPTTANAYDAATNHLQAGAHDAAGNQTIYGGWQMTYDAENRQIAAYNSTTSTTVSSGGAHNAAKCRARHFAANPELYKIPSARRKAVKTLGPPHHHSGFY